MSNKSERSVTSDFADKIVVEPKPKKNKFLTPAVVSAMDRVNITSGQATYLFCAFASAHELDLDTVSVSHSTIHRNCIEIRQQIAEDIKNELKTAPCVVLHWDKKMLPDIIGEGKVDRLAIIL